MKQCKTNYSNRFLTRSDPHWDIFWSLSRRVWIEVTGMPVEDRSFEVFAKEFGSKIYSVQSHPDLEKESSTSMEETNFVSLGKETPAAHKRSQANSSYPNLNLTIVDDPLLDAIIE
ncbi:hypothetical protein PIB30_083034 [Stylosanthes scabra]|uniref:Uncharacterized protein n=1 Tax=Stylosanthes scabra TaxID=79078 RepID=A0ABU6VQN6_9FABA|nr:hypothetical protein [Stylosanthes scabra]